MVEHSDRSFHIINIILKDLYIVFRTKKITLKNVIFTYIF